MEIIIRFLLGNLNIWTPVVAIVLGLIPQHGKPLTRAHFCATTLRWFLLLTVGLIGIEGFIFHAFLGQQTAAMIGWQDSPFQYEVAVANLSFGVLGIIAFIKNDYNFNLATVIGFAVWFFGDGVGHIYQLLQLKDMAPYNAGSTLYTDLLLPIMGLLLVAGARQRKVG